jgi:hypothetical protein
MEAVMLGMLVMRMQLVIFLVFLSTLAGWANAAGNCGAEINADTFTTDIGPRHHPVGRPLPRSAQFKQPTYCGDGVWFFDLNHNGSPEPGEPKLFGPQRVIGCSTCHADSPEPKTEAAANVFLRQDVSVLCLICHNL